MSDRKYKGTPTPNQVPFLMTPRKLPLLPMHFQHSRYELIIYQFIIDIIIFFVIYPRMVNFFQREFITILGNEVAKVTTLQNIWCSAWQALENSSNSATLATHPKTRVTCWRCFSKSNSRREEVHLVPR
jgi:hypothetical protein